jgi:hypothetical protein
LARRIDKAPAGFLRRGLVQMSAAIISRSSWLSPGSRHRRRSNQPNAKSRSLCQPAPGPPRYSIGISWNPPVEFSLILRPRKRADEPTQSNRIRRAAAEPEVVASGYARKKGKRQRFGHRPEDRQTASRRRQTRRDQKRKGHNIVCPGPIWARARRNRAS